MHWDRFLLSVVVDGKDGDGLHFEKFSLNFLKVLVPIFKAKPKMYHYYSSCQKLTDVSVLNFKPMFAAWVKVTKKGFCLVMAGKLQKCGDRSPLRWTITQSFFITTTFDKTDFILNLHVRVAMRWLFFLLITDVTNKNVNLKIWRPKTWKYSQCFLTEISLHSWGLVLFKLSHSTTKKRNNDPLKANKQKTKELITCCRNVFTIPVLGT